jgi:hypothetical protein
MLKRQSQLVAIGFAAAALFAATSFTALAQKKYGPGVTDTEIKIGNITPYSGPASESDEVLFIFNSPTASSARPKPPTSTRSTPTSFRACSTVFGGL